MFDVSIAGEVNLDLILYGLPESLPVEREVLADGLQVTLGGSSSIVAHNLAVLGAKVGFSALAGRDDFGKMALQRLSAAGVDLAHVVYADDGTSTGLTVLLSHGMRRRILTYPGTMTALSSRHLNFEYLSSARHFHLSSLFLQRELAPSLPSLFRRLKQAGLTLSLDTNDDPEDRWEGVLHELLDLVDVFLPNEAELCRIMRRSSLDDALTALSHRVPCIAVKCGPRGAVVQTRGVVARVAPVPVSPVDTIGAGDSFDAGFLYAWLQGRNPAACAAAGNATGALSTLRPGGTEAFLDAALRDSFLRKQNFPFR